MKRPLSDHARGELRDIAKAPVPSQAVNPGVARKLLDEGLVVTVDLPSPYKTHKGASIAHLRITDAGAVLASAPQGTPI